MPKDQIFVGVVLALLCAAGLWFERWFLEHSKKGQRLVRWFGPDNAVWVLRVLLIVGLAAGILLAVGVLNPLQW